MKQLFCDQTRLCLLSVGQNGLLSESWCQRYVIQANTKLCGVDIVGTSIKHATNLNRFRN